jgi:hypothetical protein
MPAVKRITTGYSIALVLAFALGGCGKVKMKQDETRDAAKARAEAKRHQTACASSLAYDKLKGHLFDRAIGQRGGDRSGLDMLADYSFARMEDPVVKGWDPALDITHCAGRFILQLPPGASRAFAGENRLQAEIAYTAQSAADGSGYVYQLEGAEPIVARLAGFNLASGAYRPPPAIDNQQAGPDRNEPVEVASASAPVARRSATPVPSVPSQRPAAPAAPLPTSTPTATSSDAAAGEDGEATVRAFYDALGVGNGTAASARIVAEKRTSGAFSPGAMSRFYGRLAEPIRLTEIVPLGGGAFKVRYRYASGRSRCNGSAIVSVVDRSGRDTIRSIRALRGC